MTRVPIQQLRAGMVLQQDIFSSAGGTIPLLRKDTKITATFLDMLRQRGVNAVFVKDSATSRGGGPSGQPPVNRNVYVPKSKPVISESLRLEAVDSLQDLFQSIGQEDVHASSVQIIRHLDKVVEQLVESIGTDRGALININDLKSYDEYTYHHSLSVAVLSIAIGQHLGLNTTELNRLGKCSMMHDIGKTAVPIEIIHKPSRLSDIEFATVKNHSPAGYEYLLSRKIGDEELWLGVLGHHEKYDGTGYPNGLKGDEIPLWSRIISVADVYDALTSNRPYRSPMQPAEAIEYIMGGVSSAFDYDMVDAFVKKVELYPMGSFIELSDGRLAVVLNSANRMRPVIRLLDTGETVDLYRDRSFLSVVITRVVPDEEVRPARVASR